MATTGTDISGLREQILANANLMLWCDVEEQQRVQRLPNATPGHPDEYFTVVVRYHRSRGPENGEGYEAMLVCKNQNRMFEGSANGDVCESVGAALGGLLSEIARGLQKFAEYDAKADTIVFHG